MIRAGSSEVQLVGLDPEEFPLLPRLSEEHVCILAAMCCVHMIRQTAFAASTNETFRDPYGYPMEYPARSLEVCCYGPPSSGKQ